VPSATWLLAQEQQVPAREQPQNLTSLTLLDRVRANDQQAWQRLVGLYSPLVYHWCTRWRVIGADADDVVQNVFVGVAASIENFQRPHPVAPRAAGGAPSTGAFRGWLGAITRNKLRDFYERRQRQPAAAQGGSDAHRLLQELPADTLSDDAADAAQVSDVYHRALELIREDFQETTWQAFWRTALENQTPAEVGPALGLSTAAVRQAKARVLRRLKEVVGDLIG
jgi:RNA polymerase sigma-70 factor (ECF subfamily)